VLVYPSALDLSTRHLRFLTDRLAAHRAARGLGGAGCPPAARRCWSWRTCARGTPTRSSQPGSRWA